MMAEIETSKTLTLEQPKWHKREYILQDGEATIATLAWDKGFSTGATAQVAERQWMFKQPKAFSNTLEVHRPDSDTPVATVDFNWKGEGTISLADGRTFRILPANFWQNTWSIVDQDDQPLLTYRTDFTWRHMKSTHTVTQEPSSLSPDDQALLTMLGWYIMLNNQSNGIWLIFFVVFFILFID